MKCSPVRNTFSHRSSSKSKGDTLEVEWTHLKTPPTNSKQVVKSPSQTTRITKKAADPVSSTISSTFEKSSTNRRVAQKSRTTNLSLSMKLGESSHISQGGPKSETDNEGEKQLRAITKKQKGFSTSPSSTSNQQSMEMRNRGALNKKSGTLMSFGVVHDKYTKGIDIPQCNLGN